MTSFKCFVEYNTNRYDIEINDNLNKVSFNNIYNKIKQIIEMALNTKISLNSHVFQVFIN